MSQTVGGDCGDIDRKDIVPLTKETKQELISKHGRNSEDTGSTEVQVAMLTKRINDVISRRIADRPELWLWMHDRWKGNASGEIEVETTDDL